MDLMSSVATSAALDRRTASADTRWLVLVVVAVITGLVGFAVASAISGAVGLIWPPLPRSSRLPKRFPSALCGCSPVITLTAHTPGITNDRSPT